MVAATLALDDQQPTVGFFLAIKDKEAGRSVVIPKKKRARGLNHLATR